MTLCSSYMQWSSPIVVLLIYVPPKVMQLQYSRHITEFSSIKESNIVVSQYIHLLLLSFKLQPWFPELSAILN